MRAIKYRELKRMYDAQGPEKTVTHLQEALRAGDLKPEDFSIRELAEATLEPRAGAADGSAPGRRAACWRPATAST